MKKVHTEIYAGKRIDIFRKPNPSTCVFSDHYTFEIDGNECKFKDSNHKYKSAGIAIGAAKKYIKLNMSKEDEIKKLESEISELHAKLAKLKA